MAGTLLIVFALYRRHLNSTCTPAAFAWSYVASLFMLGGCAWYCQQYGITPGDSDLLLTLLIAVLWIGSFALCLTARHLLHRLRQ